MIAPREPEGYARILALGLNESERSLLQQFLTEIGGELTAVETDLDMWSLARSSHYDLCIAGQCESVPNPSYLIWLLKGITQQSRIVLVVSETSGCEIQQLDASHIAGIFQRPIAPVKFIQTIESALVRNETPSPGWFSSITNLFQRSRRQTIQTEP